MWVMKTVSMLFVVAFAGLMTPAISAPSSEYLLAAGSCWHGELGVGYSCSNATYPGATLPPTIVPDLDPADLAFLHISAAMTVLQWKNGSVGGMGDNRYGAMGPGTTEDFLYAPTLMQFDGSIVEGHDIESLSPGAIHVLARLDNGSLVGWGSNYYGLLANGLYYQNVVRFPVFSSEAQPFMPLNVTCGGFNCYGLQNGRLIASWGDGDYCSLGWAGCNPGLAYLSVTTPITPYGEITEQNIELLRVGNWYALALTDQGVVWSVGIDRHIGRSDNATIWLPINSTLIGDESDPNSKIIDMHIGDQHSLLLTADRRIFAFGHSYYGQLGNPDFNSVSYYQYAIPTDMAPFGSDPVEQIYARSFSSLARTSSGTIFVWGTDDYEWGYTPMIHPNYTQYIAHYIYPSAGAVNAVFMIASDRPVSPSSPPSFFPSFSPSGPPSGMVGVPGSPPGTPTSNAPSLQTSFSLLAFASLLLSSLIGLVFMDH